MGGDSLVSSTAPKAAELIQVELVVVLTVEVVRLCELNVGATVLDLACEVGFPVALVRAREFGTLPGDQSALSLVHLYDLQYV